MGTILTDALDWAASEFTEAELGDRRRCKRLIRVAGALARDPHGTLPQSFEGWSEAKAAYRLLGRPDVCYDRIIGSHLARVQSACNRPGEYLLIEDTTSLDFTSHLAAQDLGRIGDDGGRGLYLHSMLALRVERWNEDNEPEVTVEGLFHQHWWARTGPTIGSNREKKKKRFSRPRESQRWAAITEKVGVPPQGCRWTYMADRESDIYEAFEHCRKNDWRFIIRASHPRALSDQDGSVFTRVAKSPELGEFTVDLRARPGQAARRARLVVRACTISLRGPWRPGGALSPLPISVVEAQELDAPEGVEAIHWVLLTDWPCASFQDAIRVIRTYTRRWLVEEYHKCLKSGTKIEDSQLSAAHNITALLGILAVVAVRLLQTKLQASTLPDEVVLPESLPQGISAVLGSKFGEPSGGWTNRSLLVAIARLGGFLARKGDGNPGWLTIWRGWQKLMLLTQGFDLAQGERCG